VFGNNSVTQQYEVCVLVFCIDLEKPKVEIPEIICIFCVIEMLVSMLGSMPEMVQQAEIRSLRHYVIVGLNLFMISIYYKQILNTFMSIVWWFINRY